MISENQVQAALDFLVKDAEEHAEAVANRAYVEEYRKSLKAIIMAEHVDKPVNAQEREAYSDPRYIKHLDALKVAVYEDERFRFLRQAYQATIEAWRSQSANERVKL